ncbi:MAG: hypothetical protein DRJ96_07715 [Thermoprotei archaeon]|nr:MAG: hypothetical protein DRJ67_08670 [Thermoprotei archaeon]RLE95918.1 MAG: hypothetical protein DRJ96_07715 [Thermoprotei archaeon]
MFWRRLSASEYKVLLAIPRSLTYTEVAKRAGLSPSYANVKVKELARSVWIRFWVDYRAMGLSPTYLLARYSEKAYKTLASVQVPFVKRVVRVWAWDGVKLLVEACPPLGLERRFAYSLPIEVLEVWVKEWEARYVPSEGGLTAFRRGELRVRWGELPARVGGMRYEWGVRRVLKVDRLDLLILREKEMFSYTSLSAIAKRLRVSQQLVSYHYRRHVRPLWRLNYLEPKLGGGIPVIYRLRTADASLSLSLLAAFSQVPWLIDAFALQGDERTVVVILDAPPEELVAMHSALLSVDGVLRAEPLAFLDAASDVYHGLTAHLGLSGEGWSIASPGGMTEIFK